MSDDTHNMPQAAKPARAKQVSNESCSYHEWPGTRSQSPGGANPTNTGITDEVTKVQVKAFANVIWAQSTLMSYQESPGT